MAVGVWRRPPDIAHTEKLDGGGFVFILLLLLLQNGEISAGLLLSSISLLSSPTCLLWFPVFSFHNFSHQTYYVCLHLTYGSSLTCLLQISLGA